MADTDEKLAKAFTMIGEISKTIKKLGNIILEQNKIIADLHDDVEALKKGVKYGNQNRSSR